MCWTHCASTPRVRWTNLNPSGPPRWNWLKRCSAAMACRSAWGITLRRTWWCLPKSAAFAPRIFRTRKPCASTVITASSRARAVQARPRAGLDCASSRHRSNVCTETPISCDTTPTWALSGGNNRATALFLNASPYRAISHPCRPQVQHHREATTILTRGEGCWPSRS